MHHRGYHVLLDYVIQDAPLDEPAFSTWIMDSLRDALNDKNINIVHEKCKVFDGSSSPPGFAAVFLLDESHCSAHCYSDLGMLAIDVFSCGGEKAYANTRGVADSIDATLRGRFAISKYSRTESARFPVVDSC